MFRRCTCARFTDLAGWLLLLATAGVVWGSMSGRDDGEALAASASPPGQAGSRAHGWPIWSLAYAPDGRRLAAATSRGEVWLEDLAGGGSLLIHQGAPSSIRSLSFAPGGRRLAIAGDTAGTLVLDLDQEEASRTFEGNVRRVAASPDGRWLAEGLRAGGVRLHRWDDAGPILEMQGFRRGINAVAFSPDGARIAASDPTGLVALWDPSTGRPILDAPIRALDAPLRASDGGVVALAFAPDGRRLATASFVGRFVKLWDPADGTAVGALTTDSAGPLALAFSPDGSLLAVGLSDGSVALWSPDGVRRVGALRSDGGAVRALAFAPDGRTLATGSDDGGIRVWEVRGIVR